MRSTVKSTTPVKVYTNPKQKRPLFPVALIRQNPRPARNVN